MGRVTIPVPRDKRRRWEGRRSLPISLQARERRLWSRLESVLVEVIESRRVSSSPVGAPSNSFHGRSRVGHDLPFRQRRQLAGPLKDASVDYDRIDILG